MSIKKINLLLKRWNRKITPLSDSLQSNYSDNSSDVTTNNILPINDSVNNEN
jgi:hypothetical protein